MQPSPQSVLRTHLPLPKDPRAHGQPLRSPWEPLLSVSADVPFPNISQVMLEGLLRIRDDVEHVYLRSKACFLPFKLWHTTREGIVLPGGGMTSRVTSCTEATDRTEKGRTLYM